MAAQQLSLFNGFYDTHCYLPVLIFGSLAILYIGLQKLGGGSLIEGWNVTKASAGDNMHLIRSNADPGWPWLAVLPGSAIIGFWYWCTDQYIVQRVLAGKNQKESRRGSILAAYFKLTPVFIFLVPGMVAYALTQQPSSDFATSGDAAYTSLVAQIRGHEAGNEPPNGTAGFMRSGGTGCGVVCDGSVTTRSGRR